FELLRFRTRLDSGLSLLTQPRRAKRSNAANNCPTEGSKRRDGCGIHGWVLLDCAMAEIGARSKRNFQRPESNCGVAISSASELFMPIISSIRRSAFQKRLRIFPAPDLAKTGPRARS